MTRGASEAPFSRDVPAPFGVPGFDAATLTGGYPLTITQAAVDLTNANLTVVSDGVTPILLFSRAAFANSGAGATAIILSIREGATIISSTGPEDIGATTGKLTMSLCDTIVLAAGTHNLKLTAHKINANGVVTATAAAGDGTDTRLVGVWFPTS